MAKSLNLPIAEIDSNFIGEGYIEFSGGKKAGLGTKLNFQFPPHITSDNRKGTWSSSPVPDAADELQIFLSSSPRTFVLETTYIVNNASAGGTTWSGSAITEQLKALRGYFTLAKISDDPLMVCYVKLWGIGGKERMTARLIDVDIKHGKTFVKEGGSGASGGVAALTGGAEWYPLRTDVTLTMAIFTDGTIDGKGTKLNNTPGLKTLTQDWF